MKLSTIQQTLTELGMEPSKSLGQNFLHDQNLAEWIVAQVDLKPDDHLLEIGPGLGALTEFALPRCHSTTLIEKDGRLAGFLKNQHSAVKGLEILHADALEYDVRELFPHGPTKLLGNLPYYVTSPILFKFTAEPSPVCRLVLTMQRELAERLSAQPRTKAYGALTLVIQRRWCVKYLRTLPGSVFVPAPKVESAIVVLTPREPDEFPECDGDFFRRIVKQGFSQRRKQLRKMLAEYQLDWPILAAELKISETARAEELNLTQWIQLTNRMRPQNQTVAQDVYGEQFDVVDETNQVTGKASRHEVHTKKLRHRAVHVFVFNDLGELFLQKRSRWKDAHPLKWDSSASGHLNAGDDYDETAVREVTEELGVQTEVELIGEIAAGPNTGHEFVHLYRAIHEGPFILPRSEIESGSFFPISTIQRWITARPHDFATGFLECFRLFKP